MVFELSRATDAPLYAQIESKIISLIENGVLKPEEKLPATRDLAVSLNVHRNTVVQAYQELEVKGMVYSEVGRGTFVSKYATPKETASSEKDFSFQGLYAENWNAIDDSAMLALENVVRTCTKPEKLIAFSSVVPDKHIFPLREFQNCTYQAIQEYGVDLLEMGDTQGFRPFLDYLPRFLIRRGMTVHADDLTVVSGIQQGIDLISRTLVNLGDTVLTEEMTYRGALRAFRSVGANVLGIPMDDQGMRMDVLETILSRQNVKLIYTIPTFQNPTGCVMPLSRRKQLLELAYHYGVPVIEDQYANELRLDGPDVLPLASLDEKGVVTVLGSFSKILFHGIRLGWIVTQNREFQERLIYAKRVTDWQNNYLIQGAILKFCEEGYFDKYLKKKIRILKERRDAMFTASMEFLPPEVSFERPEGGLFEWISWQSPVDAYEVLMQARQQGVLVTPKRFFSIRSDNDNGMRLGFISQTPDQIFEGVKILGNIIRQHLQRPVASGDQVLAPVI